MKHNPIICAIDTTDVARAATLAQQLTGSVGAVKLGLEFFTANGKDGVGNISKHNLPIFLDLKFHDIPNTVAGAVKATHGIGPFMMTVHAGGGFTMLRAAAEAAAELRNKPMVIGVTVLTSMDERDLHAIGVPDKVSSQVRRLADIAQNAGLHGVVCSPHEIATLREHCGKDFKLVVPGIRPQGAEVGDQKRVMTPREAIEQGADYLVIGRPITGAADPKKAADEILKSLE